MFLGYDHTIFYVPDPALLDETCTAFEDVGFLITDRHDEDRETAAARQRLICFADGSYIEILTIRDAEARARHRLARHMDGRAGWADFTLVTDRLDEVTTSLLVGGGTEKTASGIIYASGCVPHDCGGNDGFMAIDATAGKLYFARESGKAEPDAWPALKEWPADLREAMDKAFAPPQ